MKKLLFAVLVSAALGGSAFAQWNHDGDRRDDDRGVEHNGGGYRIGREVEHLNRMLNHVRGEARQSNVGWRTRSEIERVSSRVAEVNNRFRSGHFNPGWLHNRIEQLHSDLHSIEVRLSGRSNNYYRWQ